MNSNEPPPIEVHNVWTIYGLETDGREAVQPLAEFRRPQDWGDPRWTYHHFKFEWLTAPDGEPILSHCHCWTDLLREPHEYLQLFASFICQTMLPGLDEELCGNQFMAEDDFWYSQWGEMPPIFDPYDDEEFYYDDALEEEEDEALLNSIDSWTEEDMPNLGTCCACGCEEDIRNVIMLDKECPMPGRGWGCLVCSLPLNGAMAVVCDDCLETGAELHWACCGYPAIDGRVPIVDLQGNFCHDPARHEGMDTGSDYDHGPVAVDSADDQAG